MGQAAANPPYPYDRDDINNPDNHHYASIIPPPRASFDQSLGTSTDEEATREQDYQPYHPAPARQTGEKQGKLAGAAADTRQDYKLVEFAPGDPDDPKNWSKAYKWYITMVVAITCFVVAFCSSVVTSDVGGVERSFGVSHEAALVPISVFVIGFGVGEFWRRFVYSCRISRG